LEKRKEFPVAHTQHKLSEEKLFLGLKIMDTTIMQHTGSVSFIRVLETDGTKMAGA
jgi:hypothetical protein